MRELIILGAGPAGMTAAVYAARKKIDLVLVSKDVGGQLLWTLGVENYMGYQYVEGAELMAKFHQQVKQYPIEQKLGYQASSLSSISVGFEVSVEDGSVYQAQAVIVATGKRPRTLNVPGEGRLRGRGVSYCAICDGPLFAGLPVAVVGGGNSALEAAYDLLKIGAKQVYLISLTPLTGDPILIERIKDAPNLSIFIPYQTLEITGNTVVEGIRAKSVESGEEKSWEVSAVFIEIGLLPNSDVVKGLAHLNQWGEIMVNASCETGVPGLFAAGDVTDVPEKQIVVAAGEGAKAAIQAHRYLQRLK